MRWSRARLTDVGRWRNSAQRGAAAVEFALVLPVLLLVVFGVIDFGIVMAQKASLANAARTGARYGVVNAFTGTHTCKNLIDRVRGEARTIAITAATQNNVAVTVRLNSIPVCSAAAGVASPNVTTPPCTNSSGSPASPDTLTVQVSYHSDLPTSVPGLGNSVDLAGSSAYQCEYFQ